MIQPQTLLDKLWNRAEVVAQTTEHPAILFVDLHVLHEVTSSHAFEMIRERGICVAYPERTLAMTDHAVPTLSPVRGEWTFASNANRKSVEILERNCIDSGIKLFGLNDFRQGIVHVVTPELGLTWPGSVIACGDSHTSTQGAYGALAFGIGSSEVAGVLATQTLLMKKPHALKIELLGAFIPFGVTAKDISLAVLSKLGVGGAQGGVIEFCGPAIKMMSMDERMTLCNQSVEAGARTAIIGVDEVTLGDLQKRPGVPTGEEFEKIRKEWLTLQADPDAEYTASWSLDVSELEPRITYGTLPALSASVCGAIHSNAPEGCDETLWNEGLAYAGLHPGQKVSDIPIHHVFIGSCTNGRLSDLRLAARILENKKVSSDVKLWIVPGSRAVKRAAEKEGLDQIFKNAGAQWREPGCSLCVAMNGDSIPAGEICISTSNRNFAHRQGPQSRTILASPLTAAAAALYGRIIDPREVLK